MCVKIPDLLSHTNVEILVVAARNVMEFSLYFELSESIFLKFAFASALFSFNLITIPNIF